ncbi:MAG: PQQ-dependent sugar dehydrogenase [Candidatus Competibacteraceae bacterium]|nr:PQQ-dependent sugar dehydrogenase [Candidatus Competibacteraceae bacterium]
MQNHILALVACLIMTTMSACTQAKTFISEKHRFEVVTVAQGLEHPWSLAFLPDGTLLVTERPGRLRVINKGQLRPQAVTGLPGNIAAVGQGGLLDVALHPAFASNRLLYFSYAGHGEGGIGTEVARARLSPAASRLENLEVIFRALPKSRGGRHFGSRLVFGTDDYLYITLGDRGDMWRAQDLNDHAGSVIRLNDDGSVPASNPFVQQAAARPEIFTYGNRNMQGATLQPDTGLIWIQEHGPRGGDELNIVQAGANYGWPKVTYGINYNGTKLSDLQQAPGITDPIYYWDPSIAPSGLMFYSADQFPGWRGNLFVGALKFQLLVRLELDGQRVVHEERLLSNEFGRIRDVRQGPDGLIYLLNDSSDGQVLRLQPAP